MEGNLDILTEEKESIVNNCEEHFRKSSKSYDVTPFCNRLPGINLIRG